MESNISKKLSINDVATTVGMSVTGLTERFKKSTGRTPMRYLSLIRLKRAEELLCTTSEQLSRIAEMCGYDNAFYFSNAFKKEKGVSPEICGMEFIRDVTDAVSTSANIKYYADIVAEKALSRKLIKVTEGIANTCYADKERMDTILEDT